MLSLRKGSATATADAAHGSIEADLTGASISGQVAIGEHIVQIQAGPGARVTYLPSSDRPVVRLRRLPVSRLPRDFPALLGREREVRAVRSSLDSGVPAEVYGPPGSGKTVLLRHLAHRAGDVSADGQVFLSCGRQPVEDVLQFVFECCYESDVVFAPSRAQLSEHLQERRLLVLLDEVELARAGLEEIMDTAPGCLFVSATPSRLLWGEGESLVLGGLDLPAALALWERGLGRAMLPSERTAAEELCRAVDGHPLRILQAAALAREGVAGSGLEIDARAESSLSEDERAVLGPLAAVPGAPVPTTRVAAVTGVADAASSLQALEARGLVQSHGPRCSLAGAPERPLVDALRGDWREPLVASYTATGEAGPPTFPDETAAMLSLLESGARDRRWSEVLTLAHAADAAASAAGRTGTWGIAVGHALEAARALGDPAAHGWALHQQGSRALCLGDRGLAASALGEALVIRERLGDALGAATTRHNLRQLGGPPPPPRDDPPPKPPPPRPRSPLIFAALGLVALAALLVVLLNGGDQHASAGKPAATGETTTATQSSGAPADRDNPPAENSDPATDPKPTDDPNPSTDDGSTGATGDGTTRSAKTSSGGATNDGTGATTDDPTTDPEPTDPEPTDPEPTDPEPTDPDPVPPDPVPSDPVPASPPPLAPDPDPIGPAPKSTSPVVK